MVTPTLSINYYQKQLDKSSIAIEKAQEAIDKHERLPRSKSPDVNLGRIKKRNELKQKYDELVKEQEKARDELLNAVRKEKEVALPKITDKEIEAEYPELKPATKQAGKPRTRKPYNHRR